MYPPSIKIRAIVQKGILYFASNVLRMPIIKSVLLIFNLPPHKSRFILVNTVDKVNCVRQGFTFIARSIFD